MSSNTESRTSAWVEVYPVVHVQDAVQGVEQSRIALEAGVDGIFLISHGSMDDDGLTEVFLRVADAHPGAFVGVNYLGKGAGAFGYLAELQRAGQLPVMPAAVWADDAIDSTSRGWPDASAFPTVEYFGGVAFKYTSTYTDDPEQAAAEVEARRGRVDVITTSGPGTGSPAPVAKIRAMKAAAGSQPLAVASGVDPSNLAAFRGLVDKVLVASSLETAPYSGRFVPERLAELVVIAHASRVQASAVGVPRC